MKEAETQMNLAHRTSRGSAGKLRKLALLLLCLCLVRIPVSAAGEQEEAQAVFRLPAPAVISEEEKARLRSYGGIRQDPMLDAAFSLLEEGNPFQARYNLITGSSVASRLPYGVPFFWGGRAETHLFCMEPDYVVEPAWQNSRIYYRAGTKYLYGFDCYGLVTWIWNSTQPAELPEMKDLIFDRGILRFPGPSVENGAKYTDPVYGLQVGDLFLMEHPGRHIAMYVGTLRMYGYTEEEIPELAGELDSPLVMHCTVNASIADRFQYLLENGLPKYRYAAVTDGGACVSLLCDSADIAPMHVFQQNQDTYYFLLPDDTWLTLLPLEGASMTCWVRMRAE